MWLYFKICILLPVYMIGSASMFYLRSLTEHAYLFVSAAIAEDHNGYPRCIACSAVLAGAGEGTSDQITEHQHQHICPGSWLLGFITAIW